MSLLIPFLYAPSTNLCFCFSSSALFFFPIALLKISASPAVNPDKAIRDIKKRLDKTIKDVKKSGDPKKIEKLRLELQRLNSIGGAKKIVPNEGIVFQYKGKTFKLTGTFASVNQILGIFF